MKFAVLGPLSTPVPLRGRHQRTLLGVLLLRAGEPVSTDFLVDALWNGTPPKSYLSNLHTYISRLRDRLDVRIDHVDGLYRLHVEDLDLQVFRAEAQAGRQAVRRGDTAAAAAHFRLALAQWRDRPLADLSIPAVEPDIAQLEATRLNLVEDFVELELAAGRHGDVVGDLERLVAEHPLRERLCGQLMVALCGAGRQADALAVFRSTRRTLVESLGVEPGAELQRLHEEILRGDLQFGEPFPICQLPPDTADFTGRLTETGEVIAALLFGASVPVVVLSGEPGIGKSALAVHAAHEVRAKFPDGQLFVHLAGKDSGEVLAALLRATGCTGAAIPEDVEERAAAWRARLADRRVLVVLDDAGSVAQVRRLLPGTPGCAVLLTSRTQLSGLPGARVFRIAPLAEDDARGLLERVAGQPRVAKEPDSAARVLAMCGNLPLALRIAATRLATRPHLSLRFLADRMDDECHRLDELSVGELQVRTSLANSYDGLTPLARKAFRRLGLLWPCSIPTWMVAALLQVEDADGVVEELVEASLLDATGGPRYRLHDLLRLYGRECVESEETPDDRLAAERALVSAALSVADQAARQLPRTLLIARMSDQVDPPRETITDFPAEQANLIAIALLARTRGWHHDAALLAERLNVLLWHHSAWTDMASLQESLPSPQAGYILALMHYVRGRYDEADAGYALCRETFERLGDRHGLACTLLSQAYLASLRGDAEQSLCAAESASVHFGATGDRHGEASALRIAAVAEGRLGRTDAALTHSRAALALARELDEPGHTALALAEVALSHLFSGDLDSARSARAEAIALLGKHANPLHDLGVADEMQSTDDAEATITKRLLLGLAGGGWQGTSG